MRSLRTVGWVWLGLGVLLALPALGQQETVEDLKKRVERLEDEAQADCKAPEFDVQWFGYRGAALIIKADPPLKLSKVEIFTTYPRLKEKPKMPEAGELKCEDCFEDDVIFSEEDLTATKDGTRRSLLFVGQDGRQKLNDVYSQNGWVKIVYEGDADDPCEVRKSGQILQAIVERHTISVDAGSVLALEKDGSWIAQPEIALVARSRWMSRVTGYVDLRYSYIGAVDETEMGEDDGSDDGQTPPEDESAGNPNPFESGGGSFRGNFSLGLHPFSTPSLSLLVGTGFSTVPDEGIVQAPTRYFASFRLEVFAYNVQQTPEFFGNTAGFFQLGYARDNLWEWDETTPADIAAGRPPVHRDERDRWFMEAQIKLPNRPGQFMSFSPRIYADFPVSGDGPSDIRVSILAKLNLQNFTNFFPATGAP